MALTLSETESELVQLSSEIRSVIEWLDAREAELGEHPLATWKQDLEASRRRWDETLRARDLLPRHFDEDGEHAARMLETLVATFAEGDSEELMAGNLADRVTALTGHAKATRQRLVTEQPDGVEIDILESLIATGCDIQTSLSTASATA